jgi:sodium transport system permease protein
MNWNQVKLIWLREVRDQLRDRRTLFMIAVLPLLLYPLLGMSFLQVAQFLREHPMKVLVVGMEPTPGLPPLVEKKPPVPSGESQSANPQDDSSAEPPAPGFQFASKWASGGLNLGLLDVELASADELHIAGDHAKVAEQIRQQMQEKQYDAVVSFPADFSKRLEEFRQSLLHRRDSSKMATPLAVPSPEIFHNSVKEKSRVAFDRVSLVIHNWQAEIGKQTLRDSDVPETAAQPFVITLTDVAQPTQRQAAIWSKILPFVLLIWALTGAFYPAIDLCAGEKERGTLETLLCSPTERSEIVTGKLFAVMLFSMATSLLNIASLGVTGLLVTRQLGNLEAAGIPSGIPSASAIGWLVLALVPASALFSALCLALAAFARSSKEGQYYLMPLILVTMPLMVLPMAPGVELTLGNSLIPLTGLVLLLRMLLEGNVVEALPFIPPVALVTLVCCRVAIRWAVDQFNRENVLFRESERWDLRLWLKHLWRDRGDTPTVGAAVSCGVLILVVQFVLTFSLTRPTENGFGELTQLVLISQIGAILIPTLAMTFVLTRRPRRTLLIRRTSRKAILAAGALAVAVHPLNYAMQWVIQSLYPVGPGGEEFKKIEIALNQPPVWWLPLLLLGLLPAVCEELAFRGFILSGLRHSGNKWRAILISSLFFALSHQILQQSLGTFVLGTLVAYLAIQSGSIWPGLVFHATHNSVAWLHSLGSADAAALEKNQPTLAWIAEQMKRLDEFVKDQPTVAWLALLVGAVAVAWIVAWFSRLSYSRTVEEELEETIAHEAAEMLRV